MNNAKMWLVVKPTVGIPLFLGAVAVGSFAVHVMVVSNTTWFKNFAAGKGFTSAAIPSDGATVAFKQTSPSSQEAIVTLPDGRVATVIFTAPQTAALAPAK